MSATYVPTIARIVSRLDDLHKLSIWMDVGAGEIWSIDNDGDWMAWSPGSDYARFVDPRQEYGPYIELRKR